MHIPQRYSTPHPNLPPQGGKGQEQPEILHYVSSFAKASANRQDDKSHSVILSKAKNLFSVFLPPLRGKVRTGGGVILFGLIFTGCAPTVHLDTPEPLKVDISVKVDVYQRDPNDLMEHKLNEEESKIMEKRNSRSSEIWAMKNDRVVIENDQGYLESKTPKSGWNTERVNDLVAQENADRRFLYESEAKKSARPLSTIEQEAGRRLKQQAYTSSTNTVRSATSGK